jgi:hypothetical protein
MFCNTAAQTGTNVRAHVFLMLDSWPEISFYPEGSDTGQHD